MGLMLDEVVTETVQTDEPVGLGGLPWSAHRPELGEHAKEQVMGLAASCKATQCVWCTARPETCDQWAEYLRSCEALDTILACPHIRSRQLMSVTITTAAPKAKKSWREATYKLFKGLSEDEAQALWQEIGRNGGRLPETRKPVKLVHLRAEARGKPRKVATSVKLSPGIMAKLQFLAERAGCDPGRIADTILRAHLQAVLREEVSA